MKFFFKSTRGNRGVVEKRRFDGRRDRTGEGKRANRGGEPRTCGETWRFCQRTVFLTISTFVDDEKSDDAGDGEIVEAGIVAVPEKRLTASNRERIAGVRGVATHILSTKGGWC